MRNKNPQYTTSFVEESENDSLYMFVILICSLHVSVQNLLNRGFGEKSVFRCRLVYKRLYKQQNVAQNSFHGNTKFWWLELFRSMSF